MNSWITTFFGLMAAIGTAVLGGMATGIIDATTLPQWVKGVAALMSVIGTAGIGFAARDNGKSSEDVGAKPSQGGFMLLKTLFLSFGVAVAALLFMSGCGTPQQITFRTAGTTIVSVDAAMSEWGAYVAAQIQAAQGDSAKLATLAKQEAAVKAAYEKYQSAMVEVCDAGAIYAGSQSTNVTAAAGALQTAIANANTEIADLEKLISSFGVTLK